MVKLRKGRMLLLGAVAALALPLAVACGGDDDGDSESNDRDRDRDRGSSQTVDVDEWTEGVCGSAVSFVEDVQTLGDDLQISDNASPDQVKEALVQFLEDVTKRAEEFEDDIKDLGVPDTDDGEDIQAAMEDAAGQVVQTFSDALKDARALNTRDQAKLVEQITELGQTLTAAAGPIENAFAQIDEDFDTTEISEAAEDIPECQELGGL